MQAADGNLPALLCHAKFLSQSKALTTAARCNAKLMRLSAACIIPESVEKRSGCIQLTCRGMFRRGPCWNAGRACCCCCCCCASRGCCWCVPWLSPMVCAPTHPRQRCKATGRESSCDPRVQADPPHASLKPLVHSKSAVHPWPGALKYRFVEGSNSIIT